MNLQQKLADERLVIRQFPSRRAQRTLAEDVREGLSAKQKFLQPKYLYDAIGSALFEVITLLPEYYPTRAETEILERSADEIIKTVGAELQLVELGSGSAMKTRFLISALMRQQKKLRFLPNDISPKVLEESSRVLLQMFENLEIEAYAADYETALESFEIDPKQSVLALFLGSNLGNFTYEEARDFMLGLREILKPGDAALIGTDLKKDTRVLIEAYDDPILVTAAFNLNLLARLNRELEANFNLRQFKHLAVYNEAEGRVEMHLESLQRQSVALNKINLQIDFLAGETIHTENSYKFAIKDLSELAAQSNFKLEQSWFDQKKRFSSNLFRAI